VKRIYIGLDVHKETTTLAAVRDDGKVHSVDVVATTAAALIDAMNRLEGERWVCTEEGTQSQWVHDTLRPHVAQLVVTMPVRKYGPKSDARDAKALAERLRRGTLENVVYKGAGPYAALRECVRAHRMITRDVVRAKNRLAALFRGRGLHAKNSDLYDAKTRGKWIAELPPAYRPLAEMIGAELDSLQPLYDQAEERLRDEASHHAIIERLMTVPCIGVTRAAYIVGTVVTPHRFRSKRQFWSYCGLAVVTSSSADWTFEAGRMVRSHRQQTRGLNANRNSTLKLVFKGAAMHVSALDDEHPLKQDYLQLVARGLDPSVARVTMARRLAATTLALWKRQEVYDPSKRYRPPKTA
jgi:transposase